MPLQKLKKKKDRNEGEGLKNVEQERGGFFLEMYL